MTPSAGRKPPALEGVGTVKRRYRQPLRREFPACVGKGVHKPVLSGHVRVARDPVPRLASEEPIDRDAEGLPRQVPQRDVDGTDVGVEETVAREEARPGEKLPQVLDPRRVLPDQDLAEVDERP
jgi:hypothetical protein